MRTGHCAPYPGGFPEDRASGNIKILLPNRTGCKNRPNRPARPNSPITGCGRVNCAEILRPSVRSTCVGRPVVLGPFEWTYDAVRIVCSFEWHSSFHSFFLRFIASSLLVCFICSNYDLKCKQDLFRPQLYIFNTIIT